MAQAYGNIGGGATCWGPPASHGEPDRTAKREQERNDNEEDAKRAKVEKEGAEGKEIMGEGSKWFVGKAPAESRMEEELDRT